MTAKLGAATLTRILRIRDLMPRMDVLARLVTFLRASPRRAALIEFVFVAPAMAMAAMGAVTWGNYFWLSHQVQEAANLALAVARSGPEEAGFPRAVAAATGVLDRAGLKGDRAALRIEHHGEDWSAQLIYDASHAPIFSWGRLLPAPSATIVRLAAS